MRVTQVAVQLYTIRDHLKTPGEMAVSFRRLREIGFRAIELGGLGPISDTELKTLLDGEGLACCASHEPARQLIENPEHIAAKLKTIGCPTAVYPYPSGISFSTREELSAFTRRLNDAGSRLRGAGIALAYHNHNIEFRKIEGSLALSKIFEETDPKNLSAELDCYWVQAGGNDPAGWCVRMKGRLLLLHMKDYGVQDQSAALPSSVFREVGQGNLDWPRIVKDAETSGCRWFVIEQDANWIDNDPFRSLKISYDYMKNVLCE